MTVKLKGSVYLTAGLVMPRPARFRSRASVRHTAVDGTGATYVTSQTSRVEEFKFTGERVSCDDIIAGQGSGLPGLALFNSFTRRDCLTCQPYRRVAAG